jgi:hypothetical protein
MKKTFCSTLLLLGFTGSVCALGHAAPAGVCPEAISTEQKINDSPAGWNAIAGEKEHALMGVTIYDGNPSEMASLVPEEKKNGEYDLAVWELRKPVKESFWIECSYQDTNIKLAKAIDKKITVCEVTYDPKSSRGGMPSIVKINFK